MRLHTRGAFQRLLPFRFRARVQTGAQHAVRQQSDILPALVQIARDAHIIGACGQGVRQAQQRRGKLMGKVLRIELREINFPLLLVFSERQVDVLSQWDGDADCIVKTEVAVLAKLRDRQQLSP